ncbi:hypothetical protein L596_014964 [Steinernema carpocapsae]|uniref:Uncharacterized protein n=1 Tax=Steinernema carpocapsae TaxID=34508 RepID=A0A4U5NEF6_STECR|nr:hypothetical protein L596_014964 [Steinernema carpocapsae]
MQRESILSRDPLLRPPKSRTSSVVSNLLRHSTAAIRLEPSFAGRRAPKSRKSIDCGDHWERELSVDGTAPCAPRPLLSVSLFCISTSTKKACWLPGYFQDPRRQSSKPGTRPAPSVGSSLSVAILFTDRICCRFVAACRPDLADPRSKSAVDAPSHLSFRFRSRYLQPHSSTFAEMRCPKIAFKTPEGLRWSRCPVVIFP